VLNVLTALAFAQPAIPDSVYLVQTLVQQLVYATQPAMSWYRLRLSLQIHASLQQFVQLVTTISEAPLQIRILVLNAHHLIVKHALLELVLALPATILLSQTEL